jgi:hypothetical protein
MDFGKLGKNPLIWALLGWVAGAIIGPAAWALTVVVATLCGWGDTFALITDAQGAILWQAIIAVMGALVIPKEI